MPRKLGDFIFSTQYFIAAKIQCRKAMSLFFNWITSDNNKQNLCLNPLCNEAKAKICASSYQTGAWTTRDASQLLSKLQQSLHFLLVSEKQESIPWDELWFVVVILAKFLVTRVMFWQSCLCSRQPRVRLTDLIWKIGHRRVCERCCIKCLQHVRSKLHIDVLL